MTATEQVTWQRDHDAMEALRASFRRGGDWAIRSDAQGYVLVVDVARVEVLARACDPADAILWAVEAMNNRENGIPK